MALLINGIDTPRMSFSPIEADLLEGGTTIVQFLYYELPTPGDRATQQGETPAGQRIRHLRESIRHILERISRYAPANNVFSGLSRGLPVLLT